MLCAKCNKDNPSDASFCEECGVKLELTCPACKVSVSPGARFCKKCGTALVATRPDTHPANSSEAPIKVITDAGSIAEALDGERKTVTALFADIKGSTALMEGLDPEAAHAIVEPVLRLMIEAVHRYEGYVVRSTGDGIFALFGAPVAHEHHPQRALYAALRLQEELKRYVARLREAGELPIEARVGVNTGEVVAYTALAPTGSIAISEDTRRLVEGYFALKAMGPTIVKGMSKEEQKCSGALRDFILANIIELEGNRIQALTAYRSLQAALRESYCAVASVVDAAVERLSGAGLSPESQKSTTSVTPRDVSNHGNLP
jgi:class 3 adenylate cyclase